MTGRCAPRPFLADWRLSSGPPGPGPPGPGSPGPGTPDPDDHLFVVLATPPGRHRQLVSTALVRRGIRIAAVGSLPEVQAALNRLRPDIVIVDAALATRQGDILELVQAVGAPLILTSVGNPATRVELLLAGVDDCLAAPFTPEELAARIVAVVRRAYRDPPPESPTLTGAGPVRIDLRGRRVWVAGVEVSLTAKEFDLLSCFVRRSGEALSRDRLLAEVWGYTVGDATTVTVHVRRLRTKVEADPSRPRLIQTVWGIGYRLCTEDHRPDTADQTGLMAVGTM